VREINNRALSKERDLRFKFKLNSARVERGKKSLTDISDCLKYISEDTAGYETSASLISIYSRNN